ncbi:DNA-binding response regulator [Virgibacillus pantothenticus]|uniref:HTH luxR-type domain-containing protein n=1 Tax=Virgibacillus pantothenticus TaxID=1473 RepID=A0A0L0QL86_VIRPA|nr:MULTISPECIES: response regulator transcription factor [Virgibacillus]API91584.1 hypothetical protein BKP57_06870 [Virgibacillus sp. 6R]KNE19331.1 hypothetical protein AFK71_12540 [Virgibacillus pantothenticus]MBS7426895.1 response regulator transcription factor [Virgibacillus sp. 19R1-5]MBU8568972.1 response regulator transcription factor [Virgibacillus pantothenticus]MBU8602246.1 response regulator transcription factor [Virgibacillus pantothenticus]
MIKILLVDREGISSEGIRLIIDKEENMEFLGVYFQQDEVQRMVLKKQPDIVLFQVNQSHSFVIELTKTIKSISKQIKIIYILPSINQAFINKSVKVGVEGFFLSQSNYSNFISMIENVYHNYYVMPKEIAMAIVHQLQKGDEKQRLHSKLLEKDIDLTWRELDIVYLLYQRKKNQEIAKILHLKEKTIRDYVSIIYKKLGVNKRLLVINLLENLMEKDNQLSTKSLEKDCQ